MDMEVMAQILCCLMQSWSQNMDNLGSCVWRDDYMAEIPV